MAIITVVLCTFLMVLAISRYFITKYLLPSFLKSTNSTATKLDQAIGKVPPSPRFSLPIIGHLHLMGGYEVPYQAFSVLAQRLGPVYQLRLGSVPCIVINGYKNIREALVTKGHHFDSRPNFNRYQKLFSGNKENSLAFCDWSDTQKTRRDMLKPHTFPRAFTTNYAKLDNLITEHCNWIIEKIDNQYNQLNFEKNTSKAIAIKPLIIKACANIFTTHFCSSSFDLDTDTDFTQMCHDYDQIFYEVNQGYAADFLPFLMPLHTRNLKRIADITHRIRAFMIDKIVEDRLRNKTNKNSESLPDYVDSLIESINQNEEDYGNKSGLSLDVAMYALEDIVGGHSAVGNFLVKLLAFIAREPHVQEKIQHEIDEVCQHDPERGISLKDRTRMPYTEATVFEAVRLIASPIVPRVANRDSTINGFEIKAGTVMFLNNFELSMSEELWDSPERFAPERFVRSVDGCFYKPEHFLPFGGGRRSCMGYKMVLLIGFGVLGGLLQRYTILESEGGEGVPVPVGSLALPEDTFKFRFMPRNYM